jgi:uncharacterized delta-60 repeat protein
MWFLFSRKLCSTAGERSCRSSFRPRLEALEDRCLPSGGVLDPTFGSGGTVTTTVGGYSQAYAVATYPSQETANNGKVVVVGLAEPATGNTQTNYMAIARYNLDGTLDRTFGASGTVITNLVGKALAVQIQPDGKVLAGGYSNGDFAVVRYNPDGTLDNSFGSKGKAITTITTGSTDLGEAMVRQSDGKIVVAGVTNPRNTRFEDLALVRFNANGTLDTSFGNGGIVTVRFANPLQAQIEPRTVNLALDSTTGKLAAAAMTTGGAVVVRFNPSGTLDTTFGGGSGFVSISGTTYPSVVVQRDDRIVLAGTITNPQTGEDVCLDRLNPDGTLDATFGSGGVVVTAAPAGDEARAVTLQPDGRIVVSGGEYTVGPTGAGVWALMVSRYNANGSLDGSFGVNGYATAPSGNGTAAADGVAIDPDGRIVVAGTFYRVGTGPDSFSLARFLAAGPSLICLRATSRRNSSSSATLTSPRPPSLCLRRILKRVGVRTSDSTLESVATKAPGAMTEVGACGRLASIQLESTPEKRA